MILGDAPMIDPRMPLGQFHDERFRSRERIRLEKEFERVIKKGKKASDERLLVYVLPNGLAWSRLGISVSKRIGNAVQRHYVRRVIREAFRRNKSKLPVGFDLICVAKPAAAELAGTLVESLIFLTGKAASVKYH